MYLRKKLYEIHYKSESMNEHINSIMHVVDLLCGTGKPLENEEIMVKK